MQKSNYSQYLCQFVPSGGFSLDVCGFLMNKDEKASGQTDTQAPTQVNWSHCKAVRGREFSKSHHVCEKYYMQWYWMMDGWGHKINLIQTISIISSLNFKKQCKPSFLYATM